MDRFKVVSDSLLRGGCPSESDIDQLKDIWNVDNIISLDYHSGQKIKSKCKESGIKQIIMPLYGGGSPNVSRLPSLLNLDGITYVHCKHGKDRTGLFCAMYRVMNEGWNVEKALEEAISIGMGVGLSDKDKDSYINAVKSLGDVNNASDAVMQVREQLKDGFGPAHNDSPNAQSMQQSWAPYLDVEVDHLNRPASRIETLTKLASSNIKLYRHSLPGDVGDRMWYTTYDEALKNDVGRSGSMYVCEVDTDNVVYGDEFSDDVIDSAILNDADLVMFEGQGLAFVVNPMVSEVYNISDVNELNVGMHDNYDGLSENMFPGTSGPMNGAGMVDGPFGLQF